MARISLCLIALLAAGTVFAEHSFRESAFTESSAVEKQLLADIRQAREKLQQLESQQLRQRQQLSKKLAVAEEKVAGLREKAALMQRLADEKTLALEDLKQRLKSWQEQNNYQVYALSNYLGGGHQGDHQLKLSAMLTELEERLLAQRQALSPQWQQRQIINAEGQLQQAEVLRLGPVSWAYSAENQSGGLLDAGQKIPTVTLPVESDILQQWRQVLEQGVGTLHFDPTLDRAIKLAGQQESLAAHIGKGGFWAIPILAFGFVACLCALLKGWQLLRLPPWLPAVGVRARQAGEREDTEALEQLVEQCHGSQRELLSIAITEPDQNQRENALFNFILRNNQHLEKWLGVIAVIAAVAPLLGLLGTVSGMIKTFKLMTVFGSGDASAVSGGISEALITTELGLIVAIPALLLHALLQRRVKNHISQHEQLAIELSEIRPPAMRLQEV